MRKLFAIALLLLFGFSFASPLLASARMSSDAMAACCHRAAKHHCAAMDDMANMAGMDGMAMDEAAPSTDDATPRAHFSARMNCCGCCAFMIATAGHATMLFVVSDLSLQLAPRSTRANLAPQRTSLPAATWQQSGNKRGPPSNMPSHA